MAAPAPIYLYISKLNRLACTNTCRFYSIFYLYIFFIVCRKVETLISSLGCSKTPTQNRFSPTNRQSAQTNERHRFMK